MEDLKTDSAWRFQQRAWIVERAGWIVMALIALAGLIGLFGSGPLSGAVAGDPSSPLWVKYERFIRTQAPTSIRVYAGADLIQSGQLKLWVNRSFLNHYQVQDVTPHPQETTIQPQRLTYTFAALKGNGPAVITFHLMPQGVGRHAAQIGCGPAESELSVSFWQLAYP
jgi:hypothetical protein